MSDYVGDQTQATEDLINFEGQMIALVRKTAARTPAGGVVRTQAATEQTSKRRFFAGSSATPRQVFRNEGEAVVGSYLLIGLPGDDIRKDDEFEANGQNFRVQNVDSDTRFQTRAWCVRI